MDAGAFDGRGFAVVGRPAYAAGVLRDYLRVDRAHVENVVVVHHADANSALTDGIAACCRELHLNVRFVEWARYGDPGNVAQIDALDPKWLAFISLDHHKSVRDRLDVRRSYIRRKPARKKIAVDSIPYEVQPWKLFFLVAFFDRDLMRYHHSYAIEQEHERFLDGLTTENPCAVERLAALTERAVWSDGLSPWAGPLSIERIEASSSDHAAYAAYRDELFEKEKSIAGVKAKLARWIASRYPARRLPNDLKAIYQARDNGYVATDLPYDQWIVSEIAALVDHTEQLMRRWAEARTAR